ncbi:MAG: cyclic nucleotide-binding domain-containing protein [Nitrospira sp.]|nr:cyclic nucleotide-binding domain-containing protein [Nitrospira sp.]
MVDPKLLQGINFFSELNDEDLNVVANVLQEQDFPIGSTIFKEGADGSSLYIIKRGEVKACKSTPEGDLLTLTLHKDGEIFGTMSFLDGRPRSATIVAISDTKVYSLDKSDFETLIDNHPRLIYKLLKNIVFSIHSIVRGMNTRYLEMINYMWGRKR